MITQRTENKTQPIGSGLKAFLSRHSVADFLRRNWPVIVMVSLTILVIVKAVERHRSPELTKRECSILDEKTGTLIQQNVVISDTEMLEACERGAVITAADIEGVITGNM